MLCVSPIFPSMTMPPRMSGSAAVCLAGAALAATFFAPIAAFAQAAPAGSYGRPDCRIVAVQPEPADAVGWKGACKDGFAEGAGTVAWTGPKGRTVRLEGTLVRGVVQGEATLTLEDGTLYQGTLVDGLPDGSGYFKYADGMRYEGGVRRGERSGAGVGIFRLGDRYEGEWLAGAPEGRGKMTYAVGGAYDGQWHAGKRHGHGVLTYAGSGRHFEGEFVAGHIAGSAPAPKPDRLYNVREQQTASHIGHEVARNSPVPPNKGYTDLSEEGKRIVDAYYPALETGDEPPYPLGGPRTFYELMAKVTGALRVRGEIMVYANVGADGKVASVGLAGLDDPELRKYAAAAAVSIKFKPAVCQGQPCAMTFPFRLKLTVEL
jgi:hypothetical protein